MGDGLCLMPKMLSTPSGLENGLLQLMSVPFGSEDSMTTTLHTHRNANGLIAHTLTSMTALELTSIELPQCLDHMDQTLCPPSNTENVQRTQLISVIAMSKFLELASCTFSMTTLLDTSYGLPETSLRRDGTTSLLTTMAGLKTPPPLTQMLHSRPFSES